MCPLPSFFSLNILSYLLEIYFKIYRPILPLKLPGWPSYILLPFLPQWGYDDPEGNVDHSFIPVCKLLFNF